MNEATLALCKRPDFVGVSSSIPTAFNVSRSKPDKTQTVKLSSEELCFMPIEQTTWVVLNLPLVASVSVTGELGNIIPVSQSLKTFRLFNGLQLREPTFTYTVFNPNCSLLVIHSSFFSPKDQQHWLFFLLSYQIVLAFSNCVPNWNNNSINKLSENTGLWGCFPMSCLSDGYLVFLCSPKTFFLLLFPVMYLSSCATSIVCAWLSVWRYIVMERFSQVHDKSEDLHWFCFHMCVLLWKLVDLCDGKWVLRDLLYSTVLGSEEVVLLIPSPGLFLNYVTSFCKWGLLPWEW